MGLLRIADHSRYKLNNVREYKEMLVFCGEALDERGEIILSELRKQSKNKLVEITFDVEKYSVSFNGKIYPSRRVNDVLSDLFSGYLDLSVLIDSTTLGFVELLFILKWMKNNDHGDFEVIYAEPEKYKSRINYVSDFGKHEFDLSSHSGGFKAVLGFSKLSSSFEKSMLVAVLGFERARLGQLLELDEGAYIGKILPIFGTPGFKVGWDKHSFFQSVDTLKDKSMRPEFVSAFSPIDILERLEYIRKSCTGDIMVAPFGPKPLSLGVGVFLVNNIESVSLKYDHPKKKSGRSEGVGNIHRYLIKK